MKTYLNNYRLFFETWKSNEMLKKASLVQPICCSKFMQNLPNFLLIKTFHCEFAMRFL